LEDYPRAFRAKKGVRRNFQLSGKVKKKLLSPLSFSKAFQEGQNLVPNLGLLPLFTFFPISTILWRKVKGWKMGLRGPGLVKIPQS